MGGNKKERQNDQGKGRGIREVQRRVDSDRRLMRHEKRRYKEWSDSREERHFGDKAGNGRGKRQGKMGAYVGGFEWAGRGIGWMGGRVIIPPSLKRPLAVSASHF